MAASGNGLRTQGHHPGRGFGVLAAAAVVRDDLDRNTNSWPVVVALVEAAGVELPAI